MVRFSYANQRTSWADLATKSTAIHNERQMRIETAVTLDKQRNERRPPPVTYVLPLNKMILLGFWGGELSVRCQHADVSTLYPL